jgi:acyl-CoA dehydrogenase
MAWDFETDPDFQQELDWADALMREEIEPLDLVLGDPYDKSDQRALDHIKPLQQRVKDRGLWACHLGPELGGRGYGQLKLALLNEILGRSSWAPTIFGCQAPDSGNAEIIAHYGTDEQKARYLRPLLEGEISSCYSMTEPHAGADPTLFTTRAELDGEEWVINGEKFYISGAGDPRCKIMITMVRTSPEADAYRQQSQILVPRGTPGLEIRRGMRLFGYDDGDHGGHAEVFFRDVRVPAENLIGEEGGGFAIAQARLGPGRIHHCMRLIGMAERALELMCRRVTSRVAFGRPLAEQGVVQEWIAEARVDIEQLRLLVLKTAWLMDTVGNKGAHTEIQAIKIAVP